MLNVSGKTNRYLVLFRLCMYVCFNPRNLVPVAGQSEWADLMDTEHFLSTLAAKSQVNFVLLRFARPTTTTTTSAKQDCGRHRSHTATGHKQARIDEHGQDTATPRD